MKITHLKALEVLCGLFVVLHALGTVVLLCSENVFVVSNSLLLP